MSWLRRFFGFEEVPDIPNGPVLRTETGKASILGVIRRLERVSRTGVTEEQIREVLDAVFHPDPAKGWISANLDAGNRVVVRRFGSFVPRHVPERVYHLSGQRVTVAEHMLPVFRASEVLKRSIKAPGAEDGNFVEGEGSNG